MHRVFAVAAVGLMAGACGCRAANPAFQTVAKNEADATADSNVELQADGAAEAAITRDARASVDSQPPTALGTGLVGYWRLDDGIGGMAVDSSGNGNTGTLSGNLSWSTDNFPGASFANTGSLVFDGGSLVTMPPSPAWFPDPGQSISVAAWVKIPDLLATGSVINTDDGSGPYWSLGIDPDERPWAHVYESGCNGGSLMNATASSSTTLSQGVWHHLATVLDRARVRLSLYVDGVFDTSISTAGVDDLSCYQNELYLGYWRGQDKWFSGLVDDVRIYNRVLSDEEVAALHAGG